MIGNGRRTGVAALLCGLLPAALAGCLNMSPDERPNYAPQTASANPGCATCSTAALMGSPAGTPQDSASGSIKQSAYFQEVLPEPSKATMPVHPGLPGSPGNPIPGPGPTPTELAPVSHPPYTIAPPDIITIDAVRLVPKPPYHVEPLEVLYLNVTDTLPNKPILGAFVVSPEGTINLGFDYGTVHVGGMTMDQIQTGIRTHLGNILRNAQVTVALAQFRGLQQLRGEHLVRPDGTIGLGSYGSVYVAGMSLGQAKCVIEKHLSEYLLNPQIAIDVFAYNSKVFYVIFDGGGFGQQVYRLPVTGNETVLDAIGYVQGLAPVSSKHRIWLARPSPAHNGCNQILPVDWNAITMAGSTGTNYQIFPGDRVYVSADCLITFDNYLSKILAPVERLLGATLLGASTAQSFQNLRNNTGTAVIIP
ncbi:MAG TPA: polysaccharide biosynthesis/export family protein [Gemmataceae bacterium]|jgi:polysaccharide export outer membrane protein|nr:polysaccharide biosynthesis/export family protein [Gemmataceae bacterium]